MEDCLIVCWKGVAGRLAGHRVGCGGGVPRLKPGTAAAGKCLGFLLGVSELL